MNIGITIGCVFMEKIRRYIWDFEMFIETSTQN